ncbi:tRNA: m1A22 methyltransferase [Spiroplasma litorale]|uniref:tRNA: m1A22 methyltransferase n=1 Tax=Spiroplasma litorale TaxID=216942 RepID=A0A0K1W1I3_9MOLU|nr:class I SAM-dependent methyltransferase [Spiroplasma litorale]AKX33952.1 tRNA: m1A22 methyltransferase [Spiroplasma litorale]
MSFLTPRLFALAKLINEDDIVADIGTDHAYLPIYLAKDRKAKKIYATDISEGPLNTAINNIRSFGVENIIETKLADGIEWTKNNKFVINTCIISGVGSNTMLNILSNDNKNIDSYIFCTNTSLEKIREWSKNKKYFIESETLVEDNEIIYEIIKVNKFAGKRVKNKKDQYFGPWLRRENNKMFINKLILEDEKLRNIINQIPKEDKKLKQLIKYKKLINSTLKRGIKLNDKNKN